MKKFFLICCAVMIGLTTADYSLAEEKTYIGSEGCKDCHEQQYDNFMKYSKKAHSFDNIKKMEKKLTKEEYQACFECHTTGYKQKGGFISEDQTPGLKNPGCEVCHGPGSLHADTEDPDDIVSEIAMESCNICHSEDRIGTFDFKPLLFGGAH